MNYQETLSYLYSRLPMFTRVGASALKKDLTNTIALCKRLNNPQNTFKSVHVGGTNGKGSTSHMLAAVLQTAGYKTGLYTSPHLLDFRERIRVNGAMIPEQQVTNFVNAQKDTIEEIEPSFFELTVAMAFDYFARQQVDIAIIEVGLGGRLDSTNIISPILSVITNIGYDHMNILGNTLAEIAYEKAGIIKKNIPVVIGQKQDQVAEVFLNKATETSSDIRFADEEWMVTETVRPDYSNLSMQKQHLKTEAAKANNPFNLLTLSLDLTGTYQLKNVATVLSATEQLCAYGFSITNTHIQAALKQVKHLTGLMGRWQVIHTRPLVICDTGHNVDGIQEVLKNIAAIKYKQLHMVIGMVKDKNTDDIIRLLPSNAIYYFCQPNLERAKPAQELARSAREFGLKGLSYISVKDAFESAKASAGNDDLIFVGGSTFIVAEVI